MNTDDGALYVPLTGDSKQFIGAIDEAERRVKGFSSATVAEGKKIDKAFEDLAQRVKMSKDLIAATEADIKKMEGMLKTVAPGAAKQDLTGELNAAKKALLEEKAILTQLETQVKATSASHVTLRTQLRQMKEELVGMEAAGKRGTAEYGALQKRFADLTNAMGDAQKQANVLANDERGMQGLIMGFSGLTGAASAAQGAIGLFSGENENLHKIMLKVQSLMAITIGMQQIQTTLNKDSAFMIVTVGKAKDMLAAAELRFATALGISNVAAKALMATLTLGLSVAIGVAIAAITKLVQKSQEAKKATQEFNKATAEAAYKSLSSFEQMRLQWNSLGSDMSAKNKFIKDNEDAFKDLGVQITGVNDAENIFAKNTNAFKSALMERAKALASAELAQEKYKKYLEKDLEAQTMKATRTTSTIMPTAGEVQAGPIQTVTSTEYRDKWLKTQNEANALLTEFNNLMAGSAEHEKNYKNAINDLGVATTENLEKVILLEQKISEQERLMLEAAEKGNKDEVKVIHDKITQLKEELKLRTKLINDVTGNLEKMVLLEQKISEQERLMLEAVEAGNTQEAKIIAGRIEKLQEELRLRNMLVNAIYAQSRANDVITNMQSGAWQPAGAPAGSIGAPSTGGKAAGSRYYQTPVFDLETAKKTLAVMDQQLVNARNAEAIKKKLKRVDDEVGKITDEELKRRQEITQAVSGTVAILEKGGLLSSEMASQLQGMIGVAGSLASGDYLGAIVNGVAMFVDAISQVMEASDGFEKRLERMNILLEKQARLVDLSQRQGGGKEAREAELETLRKQVKLYEEQVAKAEKRLENAHKWNLTGNKREKELKEVEAAAEEARIALEDAEQAYKDFLTGGVTQETIADTISAGLMEGKRSVEDFAQDMNNILTQAVTNAISAKILGPAIDELTNYLAEAMKDGVLSPEEAERYKTMFGDIAKKGTELADASSAALRSVQAPDTTLTGAIKGISEQTAGVLAGQVNAMRINQVEGIQIMRQQLMHLAEIALNTRYNRYLASIDSRLAAMSADNLRAQGLNG